MTALVNVVYCLEEMCRGIDTAAGAVLNLKKLLLCGYGNMDPALIAKLGANESLGPILVVLLKLTPRGGDFGGIFAEMLVCEVLADFLPRLAAVTSIPHVGKFVDDNVLPLLHFACCLVNTRQIAEPQTVRTALQTVMSTAAVMQCLVSRFSMATGATVMAAFEELLQVNAEGAPAGDALAVALALPAALSAAINAVDWSPVAEVSFPGVVPTYAVMPGQNAQSVTFEARTRRFVNATSHKVEITWLTRGLKAVVPPRGRNAQQQEVAGVLAVPAMGELLRTAIAVHLAADADDAVLAFLAG